MRCVVTFLIHVIASMYIVYFKINKNYFSFHHVAFLFHSPGCNRFQLLDSPCAHAIDFCLAQGLEVRHYFGPIHRVSTGKRVTASAGEIPQRVFMDEIPEKTSTLHIIPPTFADENKGGKQWKARDKKKGKRRTGGKKQRKRHASAVFTGSSASSSKRRPIHR